MNKTKELTLLALFIALVTVATLAIRVPIPATGGYVNTYGTSKVALTDGQIAQKVREIFSLRPYDIEQRLKLRYPIYSETIRTSYCLANSISG